MMFRGLLGLVTQLSAAAALADAPAPPPAALPTPYSAEQIRDVWQPGFQLELSNLEGGVETRLRMTVLSATPSAATIRSEPLEANGQASGPAREATATWSELRDHARLPAASSTRERAECHSRLGSMPGWRYATTRANGEVLTMCFADATPGPPVEYETRRDGKLLSRTEHTQYGRPTSGAQEKP
jgi:hypothetical protein